ncbi:cilia- and flagella-associated protein 157 [Ambystoma mexicanum]|uniref:cilia- and flagella-associated protein 157 n=1 Tax=Ambystoma mexicanum TaxID=8296 RepID=UPI0037E6FEB5
MPPKKKGKKKGDGGSAKGKPAAADQPVVEPMSEVTKEFYLIQIRDLEGQLARYQRRWDELQVKEETFQTQLDQVSLDKKEIVAFLKRTLDQRVDEITILGEKIADLQLAKDTEKETYEAQLAQLRHESQETKDQLTAENMLLAGKLAALEEFRVQKEDLSAQFTALEEKLKKQEEEYTERLYKLERKAVVDKDRLKKETVQRVNMVAAEFRKVSSTQIAETTKRTIRENVSICAQLSKMSDKSMELILENDHLKAVQTDQRRQVEMLEHNEKELVKNNQSNQKLVRMLKDKCHEQQVLLEEAAEKEQKLMILEKAYKNLQDENNFLREQVDTLEEMMEKQMSEGERLSSELQQEHKNKRMVETILGQAASALKDVLLERPSDDNDREKDVVFAVRRNEMLQKLLTLLNSAAELGLGPKLQEFLSQRKRCIEHKMVAKGDRINSLSPLLKDGGAIAHYRMGDLGLVPRPGHSSAVLSKIGLLSRTSRLGPLRENLSAPKYLDPLSDQDKPRKKSPLLPDITPEPSQQDPPLMAA